MKRDPKRIERILRVRQLQEESARGAWMRAQAIALEADAQVARGQESLRQSQEFIRGLQAKGSIDGVLAGDAAMVLVQRTLAVSQADAIARHREVDLAKAPWIEARRAARGIEKLHERAEEEQRIERMEREDKALESSLEALLTRQKNNPLSPLSA
jgi:flagellar biosynthesis chaperone FliJ